MKQVNLIEKHTSLSTIPIEGHRVNHFPFVSGNITLTKNDKQFLLSNVLVNRTFQILTASKTITGEEYLLPYILNNLPAILLFIDKKFKLIRYNKAAENYAANYYGIQLTESECIDKLGLADEYETLELQHFDEIRQYEKEVLFERYLRYRNGKEVWFCSKYYPLYEMNGSYIGCLISSSNITNDKKRRRNILKLKEQLREIEKIQKEELTKHLATLVGLVKILNAKSHLNKEILFNLRESVKELEAVVKNRIYQQ